MSKDTLSYYSPYLERKQLEKDRESGIYDRKGQVKDPESWEMLLTFLHDTDLAELAKTGEITVALIKPNVGPDANSEGLHDFEAAKDIEAQIEGLETVAKFSIVLDETAVDEFYEGPAESMKQLPAIDGQGFSNRWEEYKDSMTDGPVTVLILYSSDADAVPAWRSQIGNRDIETMRDPDTIRGRMGVSNRNNLVHGSDSVESVGRELRIITEQVTRTAGTDYGSFAKWLEAQEQPDPDIQLAAEIRKEQLANAFHFMNEIELYYAWCLDHKTEGTSGFLAAELEEIRTGNSKIATMLNLTRRLLRSGNPELIQLLSKLEEGYLGESGRAFENSTDLEELITGRMSLKCETYMKVAAPLLPGVVRRAKQAGSFPQTPEKSSRPATIEGVLETLYFNETDDMRRIGEEWVAAMKDGRETAELAGRYQDLAQEANDHPWAPERAEAEIALLIKFGLIRREGNRMEDLQKCRADWNAAARYVCTSDFDFNDIQQVIEDALDELVAEIKQRDGE